jgi:hypothetical protein
MIGIRATITRYISDDPQPGIVECEFVDAFGHKHTFIEKTAIVSTEQIDSTSTYPRQCVIDCEIIERYRKDAFDIVLVNTEKPWGIESTIGLYSFEVLPSQLVELGTVD